MSASTRVMSAMAEGVPLTLLFDIAGFGPSSFELLQRERARVADPAVADRALTALRPQALAPGACSAVGQ